jgi:ABC-type anion transport system duplicated permease subunit
MTTQELDTLVRPYLLRQQTKKREAMLPWIFAFLMLGILSASGLLSLVILLTLK